METGGRGATRNNRVRLVGIIVGAVTILKSLAESVGSDLLISCIDFNAATKPGPENPPAQFILEWRALLPT